MGDIMKILMTGGGTAGHVTPNIALCPELKKQGFQISYVGTKNGIEKELIENENIDYYGIEAGKLRRYFSKENLRDISKIWRGFIESLKYIDLIEPDVVFSKGGFVSCPVVWAAWVKKVPVIIHESDLTPGLANKLSMPFARKICYAFPKTSEYLPRKKSILTGIPVREEILKGDRERGLNLCNFNTKKPIVLIIGGSLGAKAINEKVRLYLTHLLKEYQICHICGKNSLDFNLNGLEGYVQYEYVDNELKDLIAMSDIVVSRAGATTLFELLCLGKPSILVPLPKAVSRGDQILNATYFEKEGYSKILEEDKLEENELLTSLKEVLKNKDYYIENMRNSEIRNSIDIIVNTIIEERKGK